MYVRSSWIGAAALVLVASIAPPAAAELATDAYAEAVDHYRQGRWAVAEDQLTRWLEQHPQHANAATALFLVAEARTQQKNYTGAREDYLRFVQQHPEHRYVPQASFRAAECNYLSRRYDQAQRELSEFLEQYPQDELNAYVLNYLGDIAFTSGDVVGAQSWYRDCLRRFPAGPLSDDSRLGLGRSLEFQGQVDAARRQYRELAEAGGRLADDAQLQLGLSYYTRGRYDEAAAEFQQSLTRFDSRLLPPARYWLAMTHMAQGSWPAARDVLETALVEHADHALAPAMTHWLGESHRHAGDLDDALICYERTLEQWPGSEWADNSLLAWIDAALARADYERVEELAERFEREYADSPLRSRAQQAAGRALLQLDRPADALTVLERSVRPGQTVSPPGESQAPVASAGAIAAEQTGWYYLAWAYLANQRPDAALTALDRIDATAASADLQQGIQVARATLLVVQQRYAEAIEPLQEYLAQQPEGAEGAEADQCRLQLVIALARSGQWDQALQLQERWSEAGWAGWSYWRAIHELAEAAYDAERYDLAASQFRRLTSPAAPPDLAAKGWSGCGWSHFQQGDFASAAEDFQRLCRDFPGSELAAESGMMRARAYQRAGKAAEALDAFLAVARGDQAEQVPLALFEAARLHETLGDRTAALELIDRLTEQHAAFAQIDAALYQRAWLLVDLQRSADAEATFARLHEHHADSRYWSDAAYRLAERAVRAERFDRARRLVGELLDSPQTSLEIRCHTLYLQAQLAAASERWDDVAAPLERLLEEFPNSPLRLPAEYWIAESYFRQRDFESAEKAFVQLSHEIGDSHDTWLAMISLRQSQLLLQRSQWDEAHDVAQTIAARFPGFRQQYEADFVIGRCLAARAQFSQARQWYERVIRSPEGGQSETAAMAQWMIGETYMHQRDYAEAVRAFQLVDRLFAYPRWQAAALLQAGKCHQLLGEIDEAQRTFRRLLEQHPETTYAREASIASRTDR